MYYNPQLRDHKVIIGYQTLHDSLMTEDRSGNRLTDGNRMIESGERKKRKRYSNSKKIVQGQSVDDKTSWWF